jgi:hypothetical protein
VNNNPSSAKSEVTNGSPESPQRRGRKAACAACTIAVLTVLILILSTGCSGSGRSDTHQANSGLLFMSVLVIVVGVFLLQTVGRIVGEIFDLATKLAQAFASIMLVLVLAAAAVLLAVFSLAAG